METTGPFPTLDDWHRSGREFVYRGHRVFYRRSGSGPTLLLIHGFPTASWDWHRVWPVWTESFDVVAPDLLGFGFSDKPPDHPYSLMDQATLVEALIGELGLESLDLVAHDYGVSVAQELVARQKERAVHEGVRIRSVCLLNGGIIPGSHRPLLVQRLLMSPIGGLLSRVLHRGTLRRSFDRIFGAATRPTAAEIDDFWRLIEHGNGRRVFHRIIRYMREREVHRDRWVGALQDPGVPLRLINGLVDPISGAHVVDAYRRLVQRADVVELADIGHYPQVEAPAAVAEAVISFVRG